MPPMRPGTRHPRHLPWPRALLALLVLLAATLALTGLTAPAAPPPPVTLSTEAGSGSEAQQDATDAALRLPARHAATRRPDTPGLPSAPPATGTRADSPPPRHLRPHVPTPRSVVLRC
ncbi:hypothetical protein [Streptomyces sp. NPDC052114]|uniref:hypothetical protein n=1 Tax=unclassified Streptomyces TaxID=2593676 RepID=UPI00341F5F0C